LLRLCYNGCGSQSVNEGIHIPATGKIPTTKVSDWRILWQANRYESIQYMTGLFHCSWGCARDYIQGNKSGTILGFANEGKAIESTLIPIADLPTPEPQVDPMEQLIQARLVLIEVALASQGIMARCKSLTSGIDIAIDALKGVHVVAGLLDSNDELNEKLRAAEYSLGAATKYIEELKVQLGMSH